MNEKLDCGENVIKLIEFESSSENPATFYGISMSHGVFQRMSWDLSELKYKERVPLL